MATHDRANFREILLGLRSFLATALSFDPTRVIISVADQTPHYGAAQDVVLRPEDESPDEGVIAGGGRVTNRRTRTVKVVARTRLHLDPTGQDAARLTDASLGHIALEDAIADALEQELLEDDDGNVLCILTCRTLTGARGDGEDPNWVSSAWSVGVLYHRDLTQA